MIDLRIGDCLDVMAGMDANSADAIVTDPPYGLAFMGKDWDHGVPGVRFWAEALRVAKPGAHLLAFGGTRTHHRLMCAIEDAGWEIRDTVMWVYGQGFPKSHNVGKAIDKAAGAKREVVGKYELPDLADGYRGKAWGLRQGWKSDQGFLPCERPRDITAPATDAAKQWDGWGTALKPSFEPVIVARKPLEGTVAANVQRWGTGAMNIDGCRVAGIKRQVTQGVNSNPTSFNVAKARQTSGPPHQGRWPANVITDGSDEVVGLFPNNAARFFYCSKASKKERDAGCDGLALAAGGSMEANVGDVRGLGGASLDGKHKPRQLARNNHPTVKPVALMRYLCRLVTPPGGIVLDPFMGSGSTGIAAIREGFRFIGIEKEPEYVGIAERRISHAQKDEA